MQELLGNGVSSIESQRSVIFAYYHSTTHAVEVHRNYFGPTIRAFQAVSEGERDNLHRDIEPVFRRYNRATDGTAEVEYEYLQNIATRA